MKNITKVMLMAALIAVAMPSAAFAHNSGDDDNTGRRLDAVSKSSINAFLHANSNTSFNNLDREDRKDKDRNDDRSDFRLGQDFWFGTVTAIGVNSFNLRMGDGTVVTVNTTNAVFGKDNRTFAFGDIRINDKIFVTGILSDSTVGAARVFDISLPNHKSKVKGTVTAVNTTDNSFTVTTKNGRVVTVNTDGNTVVKQDGNIVALSDVTVNSSVIVRGTWSATTLDALVASKIRIK